MVKPPMAESSLNLGPASSSSSSGEVSVSLEKDTVDENGDGNGCGAVAELDTVDEVAGGSVSSGVSDSPGTAGMEVSRVNTKPRGKFSSDKSESHSGHLKLGRSKTETSRHNSQFAQDTANIFDDNISGHQKV